MTKPILISTVAIMAYYILLGPKKGPASTRATQPYNADQIFPEEYREPGLQPVI